jgi:hypothetical protein
MARANPHEVQAFVANFDLGDHARLLGASAVGYTGGSGAFGERTSSPSARQWGTRSECREIRTED